MEVSETLVKFSSAMQEVDERFDVGDEVVFQGSGEIVKMEIFNKQDGTVREVTVLKPSLVVVKKSHNN